MNPKNLTCLLAVLITNLLFSQETFNLQWKLNPTDTLRYKTVMESRAIDIDTTNNIFAGMAQEMVQQKNMQKHITMLVPSAHNTGVIDITMYIDNGRQLQSPNGFDAAALMEKLAREEKEQQKKKGKKKKKMQTTKRKNTVPTALKW